MTQPKQQASYPLRMPDELRKRLEGRAKANGRSVNAEIIAMLDEMMDGHPAAATDLSAGALLNEVINRYGAKVQIIVAQEVAAQVVMKERPV